MCGAHRPIRSINLLDGRFDQAHNLRAMRKMVLVALVIFAGCFQALCQQQLDAATKEDVEQLLDVMGARKSVQQMWAGMGQQMATTAADAYQQKHPNATPLEIRKVAEFMGRYWQGQMQTFSIDEMMDAIIPVYQRHLTHADVQSIIDFYKSPPGQKFITEMPMMMSEAMQASGAIVKKHLPDMLAAAEKAVQESEKPATTTGSESGSTPNN